MIIIIKQSVAPTLQCASCGFIEQTRQQLEQHVIDRHEVQILRLLKQNKKGIIKKRLIPGFVRVLEILENA